MTNRILRIAVLAACLVSAGITSYAAETELDRESSVINEQSARAMDLPGTVIVRVNEATGEASVLEVSARLAADANAAKEVATLSDSFRTIPASGIMAINTVAELDRNSSTSSWYAWYNYGYSYTPTYYYWGYSYAYSNYYNYNWYGYSYYWYRW